MQNNNSKWITDRKAKPKTINLLEENVGDNTCSFVVGKDFLYIQQTKGTDHLKKR